MSVDKKSESQKPKTDVTRKRPYTSPRLTEYGSVAKLTQGTLTTQNDSPAGTSWRRACL